MRCKKIPYTGANLSGIYPKGPIITQQRLRQQQKSPSMPLKSPFQRNWEIKNQMSTGSFIAYASQSLLLPPGLNLLLALAAWVLWKSWRRTARTLLLISTASLYVLAMPTISFELQNSLQSYPALSLKQIKELADNTESVPTAIVILGGGRRDKAPEYSDTDTVNPYTLERLRYGAYLHHKTQLPVLVSGGSPMNQPTAEAVMMNQVLTDEFDVNVQWLEIESKNTEENAHFSLAKLEQQGITQAILVTHSWHMPRALLAFQSDTIHLVPAPTGFQMEAKGLNYLPSAKALQQSVFAIEEHLANFWYGLAH